MTPFIHWLRLNWSLVAVLAGVGVAFFLLKNNPTPGVDSLQALDRVVASGQPTVIEFYSNFWSTCLLAKPFVDGLEKDLAGQAGVIRLDILSSVGREAARRYGVRATPTRIVLDGQGQLVYGEVGLPNSSRILAQVDSLQEEIGD